MTPERRNASGELAANIERTARLVLGVIKELYLGLRHGFIPWNGCLLVGILACIVFAIRWDHALWEWIYIGRFYPTSFYPLLIYWGALVTCPFWFWALVSHSKKQVRARNLETVFTEAGLRSVQGRVPKLVFDKSASDHTHTLRVTVSGASLEKFKKAKTTLESNLGIFIDDIRENRKQKTIDVIYAHEPMPKEVGFGDISHLSACKFIVGETRSSYVRADIRKVPHLLIAGQTGGGKSTFLRQFITTHLLRCRATFLLIDLKEGLESHLFEGFSNVEIKEDVAAAVSRLGHYETKVTDRLKKIKAAGCLDFDQFLRKTSEDEALEREFVIVDEAAELFLAGGNTRSSDVQRAKRVLSDIARRGRAAGVHLVIATQRPDSRSLDTQVKANLPGVLCFQMVNDASSITVLGTGRATEIPPIPGRAIWKVGAQAIEVQTPHLTHDQAVELLKAFREQKTKDTSGVTLTK